ncbi:probable proteasome inhibitor isoform X4 [Macadamia integrifolia]|uniref:probable proteasome inhibitor isoform X4 n=1 Tax=Macadamia integrifolia TaxID=60698 RepID=UPI001C5004DF|nr:probable proteasome inhibitor isoform X4 [Macadamia integrifolia]
MATADSVLALIRAYRPSFRNPHDKIAFAVHASFLASGYVLTATGPPAFSDTALSSPSTDEVGMEGWNATDDAYAFLYRKEEFGAKKSVLVKCLPMGDKLIVDALVVGGGEGKPVHLEIDVNKYDGGRENTDYSDMYNNCGELVSRLNSGILGKLDEPSASYSSSSREKAREQLEDKPDDQGVGFIEPRGFQPYPSGLQNRKIIGEAGCAIYRTFTHGLVHPPVPPVPPVGESDLIPGGGAGMFPGSLVDPPVPPFGESDLVPGVGAGIFPGTRHNDGGGGMLLGPNDPRWFGGVDGRPGFPGGAPDPRRPGGSTHPDLEPFGSDYDFI